MSEVKQEGRAAATVYLKNAHAVGVEGCRHPSCSEERREWLNGWNEVLGEFMQPIVTQR